MIDRHDGPPRDLAIAGDIDPAIAPFARAQAAVAFSADGRHVVWGTPGALALFGGAAPVPAPKDLAVAIARVVRAMGGSGVATLADLPLPGVVTPMSCACRMVKREEGGDILVVMPLDALPTQAAPAAVPVAEEPAPQPEADEPSVNSASVTPVEAELHPEPAGTAVRDCTAPPASDAAARMANETPDADAPPATVAADPPPANAVAEAISPFDALRRRADGRAIVRFLWQSDAAGSMRRVSPDLAAILGPAASAIEGRPLADVLGPKAVETAADLVGRLARQETVTGARVLWPLADCGLAVPVDISAMPIIEAGQVFQGFRGFGLIRVAEARESQAVSAVVESEPPSPIETSVVAAEPPTADVPSAFEATPDAPVDDPLAATSSAAETCPPPVPVADAAAMLPNDATAEPISSPESAPMQAPPVDPAPAVAPVLPFRRAEPEQPSAKVVSLRIVAPTPHRPAEPPVLSSNERRAFRDIARALGARVEDDDPPAPAAAAAPPPPAAAPLQPASAPLQPAPAPPEPAVAAHAVDILERLPVGVMVSRADRILYANRTLLDLLDYASIAAIEARGGLRNIFKTRSPETAAEFAAVSPVLLMARDGETLAVDARIQPIDWDARKATLMTVRRSVEAEHGQRLKSTELELRAREGDLRETRSILDTATDGVIVVDEKGRVLSMNRAAEALFGYDQKEIAGEPFTVLLAPESHAVAVDYLDGLKSGGVRSVLNDGREVIGRVRQGGPQPLFMTLGQVGEGSSRKFCAVLRDLTAWKKAESELVDSRKSAERANAQKSEFLAKISHEIRTPLNAIIGFAEVMIEERFGPVGNERYKDYLKDIHGSGQHVISLVNDLLDLSKIEAGRMELTFAAVDVNAVVAGSVSLIQPQAQQGRIVVRSSLSRKLPPVVADQRSLKQIVLNLLSNAVKFTDPGGQVIISTGLGDSGDVLIRVRDTGIGMSEKEIGEALEPFRQLHTTRRAGGTGLGLPLTKALVEANRAALRISSAKREGTLVEVVFPPTRVLAE